MKLLPHAVELATIPIGYAPEAKLKQRGRLLTYPYASYKGGQQQLHEEVLGFFVSKTTVVLAVPDPEHQDTRISEIIQERLQKLGLRVIAIQGRGLSPAEEDPLLFLKDVALSLAFPRKYVSAVEWAPSPELNAVLEASDPKIRVYLDNAVGRFRIAWGQLHKDISLDFAEI